MKPPQTNSATGEADAVRQRYGRRLALGADDRYSMLNPANWQTVQERERAFLRFLVSYGRVPIDRMAVIEVGCGGGGTLLELMRFGFHPSKMTGIELLDERVQQARARLPASLRILAGDALQVDLPPASQDLVCQFVVFSSLLDDDYQQQLARRMWEWVRPGGAIMWYDFIYNNPANRDVRGVPVRRIRQLFPEGRMHVKRVTLAPPIARRVCGFDPILYDVFNLVPWLRTHVLCWIEKQ